MTQSLAPVIPLPDTLWDRPIPLMRHRGGSGSGGTGPADVVAAIARAAIAIADREGLAGLSVKRVAAKSGLPATQLAAYLTSKDDLFDVVFDAFYSEVDPAVVTDPGPLRWRTELAAIAAAMKAALERHPWALELMGTRPPCGPNGLSSSERALAALDGLGLDSFVMINAVNTVLAYVCGSIRRHPRGVAQADAASTARYLRNVASSGEYPRLTRIFADTQNLTETASYLAGLNQVLDGIGLRISAAGA